MSLMEKIKVRVKTNVNENTDEKLHQKNDKVVER